jgi:GGDEF domain-containing protein
MFGNAVFAMVGRKPPQGNQGTRYCRRWGGDEFFGILAEDSAETERIARQIMESLEYEEKGERYHVSVSIGIASLTASP